ncbi:MAG: hypothetical protein ACOC5T_01515 [Elusimicrobiota bacterium]
MVKNNIKKIIKTNLSLIVFIAVIIIGTIVQKILLPEIIVEIKQLAHLHYHFADIQVKSRKLSPEEDVLKMDVHYNGSKIKNIGNEKYYKLKFNNKKKKWIGKYPIPWRARDGVYRIRFYKGDKKIGWEEIISVKTRQPSIKLEKPLKIIDLESTKNIHRFRIENPRGKIKGYSAIFDWIKYIGGNTLWYLAGQTASYKKGSLNIDFPWVLDNIDNLKELSNSAEKEEIDFGAWVSCFRIFGKKSLKPDWYRYSYKYKNSTDEIYESEGISILDSRRIEDIKRLVKKINDIKNIDYIGLDYIRPAGGGLDLVEEFVKAMDIEVPREYKNYTKREKMKWLGRIVTKSSKRDMPIIDKWNWWRARRMAKIINDIKESIEIKKPLWTFVLSWEIGHQHGQDPLMFQDAGADIISVMMYETDKPRYEYIIEEWNDYMRNQNIDAVIGNQIDWHLHQNTVYPSGPEEFFRRIKKGIKYFKKSDNLKGIFIHDFARALNGGKGPYSTEEWLMASGKGFSELRQKQNLEIKIDVKDSYNKKNIQGVIRLKNKSSVDLRNIKLSFPDIPKVKFLQKNKKIAILKKSKHIEVPFSAEFELGLPARMNRYMIPIRAVHGENIYMDFKYVWIKDMPVDRGKRYR